VKYIEIGCDDIRAVKKFQCCKNCHAADEQGIERLHVENFKVNSASVFARGCCKSGLDDLEQGDLLGAARHRMDLLRKQGYREDA